MGSYYKLQFPEYKLYLFIYLYNISKVNTEL